uniref:FGAR-AT_linker domain-containing protein n=1 Tax=Caenorhabditis japonica TaxID=281687 RepID=A0A8R1HNK5_CAEJA
MSERRKIAKTSAQCGARTRDNQIKSLEEFLASNWPKLQTLLSHSPFETTVWRESRFLPTENEQQIIEIGPRTAVKTAQCTNILSVFESAAIENVERIEKSVRYLVPRDLSVDEFFELAADKMTEAIYSENVEFSDDHHVVEQVFEIDVLGSKDNLIQANETLGLALDQSDIDFYYDFFVNKVKKNPTDVELFDLAQSDSEHSRHWFFRGEIWVDDRKIEKSLMSTIRETLIHSNDNSLIAFHDNSSSIRGFNSIWRLRPSDPTTVSQMINISPPSHLIYSAETHNFPTAVCPFQGATTGTGGRIRDIHATGRGAYEIAGALIDFPLAVVSINITSLLLTQLKNGTFDSFGTETEGIYPFFASLHAAAIAQFCSIYKKRACTLAHTQSIFNEIVHQLEKSPLTLLMLLNPNNDDLISTFL